MIKRLFLLSLLVFFSAGFSAGEPSLREKIGQMLIMGFPGKVINDSCYARSILSCHIFKLLPSNLVRSKNQFVLNSKVI
ncbi:hypothetical protein [Legionella sp. km772]|uniref:hypothetical protein n=1 Tax=Legionella sp. km772 TaxID=2498111 RepID=UPI0013158C97|nr:hypothetical protein [Legionella sp. km772]